MSETAKRFFVQDLEFYPEVSHHKDAIDARYHIDLAKIHEGLKRVGSEKQIVFVCFSNRSGSNLLLDTLARIGFGCEPGDELFNAESVADFAGEFEFTSFEQHLEFIIRLRAYRRPVFLKIGPHQLFWIANSGILSTYLPTAKFVLVERADKISQAVSLYIADETGTYMQLAREAGHQRTAIAYSSQGILKRLKHIIDATMLFQYFFSLHSIPAHLVKYEDIDADPANVIRRMMTVLDLAQDLPLRWEAALRAGPPGIVRQSDSLNAEFVDRFRREFAINDVSLK